MDETPLEQQPNNYPLMRMAIEQHTSVETVVRRALKKAKGNKAAAARALKVSRETLYREIRRYNIEIKRELP